MKKLLILSSNNGQGHNSVAQASIEAAEARGDAAVMIDALLFVSPQTSEFIEKVYINGTLHTPKLIGTGNEFAELLEKAGVQSREFTQAARHLTRFIRANRFDSVIATHVFAAQILSSVDAEENQMVRLGSKPSRTSSSAAWSMAQSPPLSSSVPRPQT